MLSLFLFLFSRDEVETRLVTEIQALRDNVAALQEMLSEVSSTWNIISNKIAMELRGCENRIRKYYCFVTIQNTSFDTCISSLPKLISPYYVIKQSFVSYEVSSESVTANKHPLDFYIWAHTVFDDDQIKILKYAFIRKT